MRKKVSRHWADSILIAYSIQQQGSYLCPPAPVAVDRVQEAVTWSRGAILALHLLGGHNLNQARPLKAESLSQLVAEREIREIQSIRFECALAGFEDGAT